jgi:hypothetical protein
MEVKAIAAGAEGVGVGVGVGVGLGFGVGVGLGPGGGGLSTIGATPQPISSRAPTKSTEVHPNLRYLILGSKANECFSIDGEFVVVMVVVVCLSFMSDPRSVLARC